jgi:hypothetical protein
MDAECNRWNMIDCHPERSEGSRFLHGAAVTVAQANPQIPRFARDDNVLLGLWSDS